MASEMADFHVSGGMWFQNCKCSWLSASVTMLLRPSYTLTYIITDIRPMHTGDSNTKQQHRRAGRVMQMSLQ